MSTSVLPLASGATRLDPRAGQFVGRAAAAAALLLLGMQLQLAQGVTAGLVAAVALLPVWYPAIREAWAARLLVFTGMAAIVGGIVLSRIAAGDRQVSFSQLVWTCAELATIVLGLGVVLWARRLMSDAHVAQWFGAGMLAGALLHSPGLSAQGWKFAFAVPAAVLVLALAQRSGSRLLELGALAALALAATVSDARSEFAILLIAALVVAWQMRPRLSSRRGSALVLVAGVLGAVLVVYNVGQALILDGLFGAETQQRTMRQLDEGGSLLLGGRPELAATLALMQDNPLGFGAGVVPSLSDVRVAKAGMASINYDPNNGYVERYMFGGHMELHSMFGDLWAWFGIPGLLFAGLLLFFLLRGLTVSVVSNTASAVIVYLVAKSLWNLFFSPVLTSITALVLAVGLVVLPGRVGVHR